MLLIGVGNEHRGDDAIGLRLARLARPRLPASVSVLEASGEATALMRAFEGHQAVLVVDAVSSGHAPGALHWLDATFKPLPASFMISSSHGFGLAEAIELARALGKLPPHLVVLGVEGARFDLGALPSDETGAQLGPAIEAIVGAFTRLLSPVAG